jgi:hypothetical protein
MKRRQRVILYGDTLVLAGVRLSLEDNPAFEVITLEASNAARNDLPTEKELPIEQELLDLQPDVVIFDTSSVQPQFHFDLIQCRSGLQLIGIDPDRNRVLQWSGQHFAELSMPDLINVVQSDFINQVGVSSEISDEAARKHGKWLEIGVFKTNHWVSIRKFFRDHLMPEAKSHK